MGTASVIGGKTLRACNCCVCHRARWYCAADDAFLCQSCDSSVRSANPLARRHHRVRLQTCSIEKDSNCNKLAPTWHHGFKRKARTPRPSPKAKNSSGRGVLSSLVPEIEASAVEEGSNEEEEQLLYRLPIFDPVLAEFYSPTLVHESNLEAKPTVQLTDSNTNSNSNSDCFSGFIQSDAELAEFAADMERLLCRGFENDSFSMEELGIVDTKNNELVKEEFIDNNEKNDTVVDDVKMYQVIDLSRETLEIDLDCRSGSDEVQVTDEYEEGKTKIGLRLEYYQAVSVEWSAHGCLSPWMNGEGPQLGLDDCSLTTQLGMWGVEEVQGVVCSKVGGVHIDEEREARVSRYREKRRTRLFSRKIRYQVRKLNAEKRPRMKGRFVKRVSF